MLSLGLLLHLHQPPTQFPEILKLVVDQSYRPLLCLLSKHPQARLTLNVTGSLLEELDYHGYPDVISSLAGLVHQGQVEITGSSIYHALLPRITETEAIRQITLNELALDKYLGVVGPIIGGEQMTDLPAQAGKRINGSASRHPERIRLWADESKDLSTCLSPHSREIPRQVRDDSTHHCSSVPPSSVLAGFFPPEMGIDERTVKLIASLGYQWVIVDESTVTTANLKSRIYNLQFGDQGRLKVVVRNKDLSLKIAFGAITTLHGFLEAAKLYSLNANRSLIFAMDGETFGHHQPKLLPFLDDLMKNSGGGQYQLVTVSELIRENLPAVALAEAGPCPPSVEIRSSTWSGGWERWADPGNEIHGWQWQLTDLAIKTVNESTYNKVDPSVILSTFVGLSVNSGKSDFPQSKDLVPPTAGREDAAAQSGLDSSSANERIQNDTDPKNQWLKARTLLDRALHSDQYWWAAGQPSWHYKLVELGARMLKEVVDTVPDASESTKKAAGQLYQSITRTGLKKYGDTVIV